VQKRSQAFVESAELTDQESILKFRALVESSRRWSLAVPEIKKLSNGQWSHCPVTGLHNQ
jgi:hypothetical protein